MPYDFIINTAVTLFVVIDPLGLAPIFVGVTDGMTTAQRREVAARATIIAIIVLIGLLVTFYIGPLMGPNGWIDVLIRAAIVVVPMTLLFLLPPVRSYFGVSR